MTTQEAHLSVPFAARRPCGRRHATESGVLEDSVHFSQQKFPCGEVCALVVLARHVALVFEWLLVSGSPLLTSKTTVVVGNACVCV